MSTTNVPLPSLESSLLQSIYSTPSKTSSTSSLASSSGSTADIASASGNPVTAVTKDIGSLLQALISGDAGAAQTVAAKLELDLKQQQASQDEDSAASVSEEASAGSDPQSLLSSISSSLSNGDVMTALHSLITYLANTGNGKGNLINTYA